ncbi:MAG: DUF554 domain-containing protein [Oscillospiraceae bacterium]|nr:DUF554 domain-containing protein [Oscillospiraceae bacterium]
MIAGPFFMSGTLLNAAGIIVGSLLGVALKRRIPSGLADQVLKVLGIACGILGVTGIVSAMFAVDTGTGTLQASGGFLLLVSLVIGCVVGELIRIDDHLNAFGKRVENRFGASGFARGFVAASVIFPVGAMAILGSLQDGLRGDISVLLIKTGLDFTTSIILASTLGIGVLFSFVPLVLFQGSVTLLAGALYPFVSAELLDLFSMVGYTIVLCIGVNFVAGSNMKVANFLPALAVPIVYYFVF